MHSLSSSMPRLFGRAPGPAPAYTSTAPTHATHATHTTHATHATHTTHTHATRAPPRARLVRRSHMASIAMSMAQQASPPGHVQHPAAPASRASIRSMSVTSMASIASAGSVSASGLPVLSPCSSASYGRSVAGPTPSIDTRPEGSLAEAEGLLPTGHLGRQRSTHMHRPWLTDARWPSERPPPRKLVKDPNGSARPAAAHALGDTDIDGDADDDALRHRPTRGADKDPRRVSSTLGLRRKMARLRELRW